MVETSNSPIGSPHDQVGRRTPENVYEMPNSRLRSLFRDFALLLWQQMYFLGRDVIHPGENLLCKNGFEKRKSEGLTGTSCYSKNLDSGGLVELHGACAGFYAPSNDAVDNFLYVRNKKRFFLYKDDTPPAPGLYAPDSLLHASAQDLYFGSLNFLNWWLDYEQWIEQETPPTWRMENFEAFASLPGSRPSLPPQEAIRWLRQYRDNPAELDRVNQRLKSLKRR